jgi:hypothetical protein
MVLRCGEHSQKRRSNSRKPLGLALIVAACCSNESIHNPFGSLWNETQPDTTLISTRSCRVQMRVARDESKRETAEPGAASWQQNQVRRTAHRAAHTPARRCAQSESCSGKSGRTRIACSIATSMTTGSRLS